MGITSCGTNSVLGIRYLNEKSLLGEEPSDEKRLREWLLHGFATCYRAASTTRPCAVHRSSVFAACIRCLCLLLETLLEGSQLFVADGFPVVPLRYAIP